MNYEDKSFLSGVIDCGVYGSSGRKVGWKQCSFRVVELHYFVGEEVHIETFIRETFVRKIENRELIGNNSIWWKNVE